MPPYFIFSICFLITFTTVPLVIAIANNSGAIANPGKRHIHSDPTPKFGGIAIAASVLMVSPFIFSVDMVIGSYLASASIMLILGIFDDVKGATWRTKLIFSLIATSIMIFGADVWIKDIGNLLGTGNIHLGVWGIPLTFFAVFGIINAINLIDGLNGLACGLTSIAFLSFAILASISGNDTVFFLSIANLGATLGLFKYNYPKARIFMGDSGSLYLGFSLAMLSIMITQGPVAVDPMLPVIILGIPIIDTLRVMGVRMKNKKHPFRADKTHLHHLMIRSGIPLSRVVKTIWLLAAFMSFLAFALNTSESWLMFIIFVITAAFIGVFIENLRIIKISASKK